MLTMQITIPDSSLVMLIGAPGAGKSTFAARHFAPTQVISSDACRALVSDDETNMAATPAAFRVLHAIARERLRGGRPVVIDATNVKQASRKPLAAMARKYGRPMVAIVFDLPLELCLARIDRRHARAVPPDAVRRLHAHLKKSLEELGEEGFAAVHVLRTSDDVDAVRVARIDGAPA
ncbi:MAG TPA: AAA family ATPase [Candidatus Dormibacteraeota bacterium]|nr:AAA family ATPase [Candidatus Dormibacteraeota bacterium]